MPEAAAEKIIMRDIVPEVDTAFPGAGGPSGIPVWEVIESVTGITPSETLSTVDTTTREDDGDEAHLPSKRGRTFNVDYLWVEDPADGARGAGQEELESLSRAKGTAGIGYFRFTTPGATTYEFLASVQLTQIPGGSEDAEGKVTATLKVSGAITVT